MKVSRWLDEQIKKLERAGIGTARLDGLVLLEDAAGRDRAWLLAHPEFELSERQIKKLDQQIKRRLEHEPLAYIRGETEFYGRQFYIDHRVLEPRSESEAMIDLLKKLCESHTIKQVLDIGTGSGALAITAKLELPGVEVVATDIDNGCLKVAGKNSDHLKAKVTLIKANLLEFGEARTMFFETVILANLPYVPTVHTINQAAMHEPARAIFGGTDGLDLYRQLFKQLRSPKHQLPFVLTESLPPQHPELANIALANRYKLAQTDDFIQLFAKF